MIKFRDSTQKIIDAKLTAVFNNELLNKSEVEDFWRPMVHTNSGSVVEHVAKEVLSKYKNTRFRTDLTAFE